MEKSVRAEAALWSGLAHSDPPVAASRSEVTGLTQAAPIDSADPPRNAAASSGYGLRKWCYERLYRTFIQPLVISRNPPWFDARGVAMGLFIGLIVPVGGQILSLTLLRMALRFNYLASLAFSLVSNPINMIPLYYGYYLLGCAILGSCESMTFVTFQGLMNPILDKAYCWEAISAFMRLGWEILIRWFVAATILSLVFGIAGYVITLRVQTARLQLAAERLGETYDKLLAELDHHLRSGKGSSAVP